MEKIVTLNIQGIKCDNVQCDYSDMEVTFDADKFLNSPCPKCGSNLLTQADYDIVVALLKGEQLINREFIDITSDESASSVSAEIKLNGTGKIEIGEFKEASISGKEAV